MNEKEKNKDEQNEFAENIKGEVVYILDAESGKRGYYCIGCKSEMQAVKSKIVGRKSYFRHDATDVKKNERECTFSNQNYRHNQAISILNRIRKIKVPPLYKYPPKHSDGMAIKLKDSEFIEAKFSKSEITFYETDEGDVMFGKNPKIDSKNLLIRPDVTFFNPQNEPILLIEIVVTHKIDIEKLSKIKRLGIDTVQITIPKDSLENIEKSFLSGRRIKWIHNNEEERTKYIYTPKKHSEGVLQIDELQRKLFGESFECRKSQINNLIRAIEKCMGSQHYRRIERELRDEIQRVEGNTRTAEEKLEKHRERIRRRIERKFTTRRKSLKTRREELEEDERKFNEKYKDLEERYNKRRKEIGEEQKLVRESILEIEFFESTKAELEEEEGRIGGDIEQIRSGIQRNIQYREELPERFELLKAGEQVNIENELRELNERRENLPEIFAGKEREVDSEFERIRKDRIRQIEKEDIGEPSDFSRALKKILDTRSVLIHWDEKQINYDRNRKAWECFKKGTYKNWD